MPAVDWPTLLTRLNELKIDQLRCLLDAACYSESKLMEKFATEEEELVKMAPSEDPHGLYLHTLYALYNLHAGIILDHLEKLREVAKNELIRLYLRENPGFRISDMDDFSG